MVLLFVPLCNFKRFCARGTLCDEYMTWHEFGFVVVLDKFNRKEFLSPNCLHLKDSVSFSSQVGEDDCERMSCKVVIYLVYKTMQVPLNAIYTP